jgi:Ca2+-binding RTX toxin-like protein
MGGKKMATVQVEPGYNLQMDSVNTQFDLASPTLATATDIYVTSNNGFLLDLQGSFTYNLDGSVASGSIITGAADYYQGTVLAGVVLGLNNIDAYTLLAHLGLDPTFEAIWQGILGGGDVIEGGNGGPNHLYGFGAGGDYIVGGSSGDVLVGYSGNNTIIGSGSYDFIDGGPGTNILTGGTGHTAFAFFASDNQFTDWITNFRPGTANHDTLALYGLPGLGNFNQVKHHERIYQGEVVIHDNIGDYIVLENVHHKAQLHRYDFHFFA